jgi:hypothetical protein
MLNKAKILKGYKLDSLDGEFGKVHEFYFDDQHWTIRYLVANTGNWLTGRQALNSPYALAAASKADEHIAVGLTKKQIEGSPSLSSDKPVSGQFEASYYGYYGCRCIGAALICGEPIPISRGTVSSGKSPPRMKRRGIPICAARTRRRAITSGRSTARLAMSRILSSMMRRGRSVT